MPMPMSRVAARTSVISRGSIAVSEGGTVMVFDDLSSKRLYSESNSSQKQYSQNMDGARLRLPSQMVVASSEADPCCDYITGHVMSPVQAAAVHNSKSCASQLSPLELSLPTIQRHLIDRTK
jgi:hypothetical protein